MDRRHDQRVDINREFASLDAFIAEYARDISLSGCFIRSKAPLPIGTLVGLYFTVVDGGLLLIEGTGEVIRCVDEPAEDAGMGVRFVELTAGSRRNIRELCVPTAELE